MTQTTEIARDATATDETGEQLESLFLQQKAFSAELGRHDSTFRIARIKALRQAVIDHRESIKAAMWTDLRKAPESVDMTEILPVVLEARYAIRHVRRWMKPRRTGTPLFLLGTSGEIRPEPKGAGLILAPWNYPVGLTLGPLVGAVAAGCTAIIKPSELAPATSQVIRDVVASVFPPQEAVVAEGGIDVAESLLAMPFDHIYFTGSPRIGRVVMAAASRHLASVTLELGGKSPTIVDAAANVEHAARTLAFSKFGNCGQTCIAPDHVYVHERVFDAFAAALQRRIEQQYGKEGPTRMDGQAFGRVVSERHADRLRQMTREAVEQGARRISGTDAPEDSRFVDATLLTDVPAEARVMQEEIFGPLLPLIRYQDLDGVLEDIGRRPKPLALYVYSSRRAVVEQVLAGTSAGATVVNDALIHFIHPELPFGGVGESGMGRGKGKAGFLAFTNERAILRQNLRPGLLSTLYPPYTKWTRRIIDLMLRLY